MKIEIGRETVNKDHRRTKWPKISQSRALVVENDPAMCALIQEVLESAEIKAVIPAKSVEDEDYFREEKFDVILIGHCTPFMDGIELVTQIRKSGINRMTPIILFSEDQLPGALARGFEAGATYFV